MNKISLVLSIISFSVIVWRFLRFFIPRYQIIKSDKVNSFNEYKTEIQNFEDTRAADFYRGLVNMVGKEDI